MGRLSLDVHKLSIVAVVLPPEARDRVGHGELLLGCESYEAPVDLKGRPRVSTQGRRMPSRSSARSTRSATIGTPPDAWL